jgi:uncharacterized membrane protein YfbV (UPF0208 family)
MNIPINSNIYYQGKYWNDFELVRNKINFLATGSHSLNWYEHFFNFVNKRTFKKALKILNWKPKYNNIKDIIKTAIKWHTSNNFK